MRTILTALATLAPTAALAHPGDHHLTVAQSAQHLLTQPDHQLAFAGLIVALTAGGWAWQRVVVRK